jgi:hypothetical protein
MPSNLFEGRRLTVAYTLLRLEYHLHCDTDGQKQQILTQGSQSCSFEQVAAHRRKSLR